MADTFAGDYANVDDPLNIDETEELLAIKGGAVVNIIISALRAKIISTLAEGGGINITTLNGVTTISMGTHTHAGDELHLLDSADGKTKYPVLIDNTLYWEEVAP